MYKPGELGRGTWMAVIPHRSRRQRGRGYRGKWESVVLSQSSREGVNRLIDRLKDLVSIPPRKMSTESLLGLEVL